MKTVGPGDTLRGKYRIERSLGSGGMAHVYLATHLRLGRKVAVKVLAASTTRGLNAFARFAQEARAAACLRSEHVVRILDVDDTDDGTPFLVMEYLEGSDLDRHLDKRGPLQVEVAVDFVLQACAGLAEAHAAGIIHRDLKPANLFLATSREGESIKLLDFGIAKATDEGVDTLSLTPVQTAFGDLGHQVRIGSSVTRSKVSADWLTRNVAPDSSVTIYPAGTIPYYAPTLRFIDVLGKNDHHIAHIPTYESLVLGHNRFDFDYVYGTRKPDLAFVDRSCFDFEAPRYMTEPERAALRAHAVTRSPAWDYDRTNPIFIAAYSQNTIHFVGEIPALVGCVFAREGADVPHFWGREGTPPRARSFRYVVGAATNDQRAALAGRWQIKPVGDEEPGQATSRGEVEGEGFLDLWVDDTADLVVDGCTTTSRVSDEALPDPTAEALRVNLSATIDTRRVERRADCAGIVVRWRIPRGVLAARRSATRLGFAAGLTVFWVEGKSSG